MPASGPTARAPSSTAKPSSSLGLALKPSPLTPLHEFFIVMTVAGMEKLKLPDEFTKIFSRYEPGYAFLREASPKQET
jgi:hypothetical protein